jgi:hypothetical protein
MKCSPRVFQPVARSLRSFRRASANPAAREGVYNSLNRMQYQSFYGDDDKEQEMHTMVKEQRDERAKFAKQKAILEQQVELLTIQLHEASEREKNLKKTYSTMI